MWCCSAAPLLHPDTFNALAHPQPGNVDTPLAGKSKDEEGVKAYGEPSGAKVLSPSHIGDAVVYAVSQPAHVAVNEIMVEPRDEPC